MIYNVVSTGVNKSYSAWVNLFIFSIVQLELFIAKLFIVFISVADIATQSNISLSTSEILQSDCKYWSAFIVNQVCQVDILHSNATSLDSVASHVSWSIHNGVHNVSTQAGKVSRYNEYSVATDMKLNTHRVIIHVAYSFIIETSFAQPNATSVHSVGTVHDTVMWANFNAVEASQ